jgi:hypothetical protein
MYHFDEVKLCWLIVLRLRNQLYRLFFMSSILQFLDSIYSLILTIPRFPSPHLFLRVAAMPLRHHRIAASLRWLPASKLHCRHPAATCTHRQL